MNCFYDWLGLYKIPPAKECFDSVMSYFGESSNKEEYRQQNEKSIGLSAQKVTLDEEKVTVP
jgi:hypothetical protein